MAQMMYNVMVVIGPKVGKDIDEGGIGGVDAGDGDEDEGEDSECRCQIAILIKISRSAYTPSRNLS